METGATDGVEGVPPEGQGGRGLRRRPANPSSERQVIRWESFLPRRSIRVLLVEHDDSTRHIVAALLRKCSYHVVAVADGLKAWDVLKEKYCSFDLVLTEVAMPSLSGIGLLSKIMVTEECKNIPVIMMSSHDSIGVVLKCMLKGAVDFLVKPVRKNELCNLWQHVWRRHCSSGYANASENNAASNHISTNVGDGSKTGEDSNQSSDARSSDSKLEMEIHSDKERRGTHLAEGGSSSRELEAKPERLYIGMPIMANALKLDDDDDDDKEAKDKPVGNVNKVNLSIQEASLVGKRQKKDCSYHILSRYKEEDNGFVGSEEGDYVDPNTYCQNNAPNNMIDFIEPVANSKCNSAVLEKYALREDALGEASASSYAKSRSEFGSSQHLQLSFRRTQVNGCVNQDFKQKHILNHSNASAFSRYGDKKTHRSCEKPITSAVCVRTIECINKSQLQVSSHGSENDRNIAFFPKGITHQENAGEATMYFQVSSESNREDAGLLPCPSREDYHAAHSSKGGDMVFQHPQFGFVSLPIPVGAIPYPSLCAGYGAMLQPVFHPETSLQPHSSAAAEKEVFKITSNQSGHHESHLINHRQCVEFHHHEENHQFYHLRQHINLKPGDSRDLSCTPVELANQSASCSQDILKGSGSNCCGETTDAAAHIGTAVESGNESGVQNCSRKGLDSDRSRREAALIKFRMKRKDRCFEKKVRYHSRKMLAEQRPRVRGQFVRQEVPNSMTTTEAEN